MLASTGSGGAVALEPAANPRTPASLAGASPLPAGTASPLGATASPFSGTTPRAGRKSPLAGTPSPLALSCLGCHQPTLNSPAMPALDTLTPAAIAAYLRRSRDTPQFGSIMARFTIRLSDADITDLAAQLGSPAGRP